ncbi:autoinducer binding domain-containing protein [Variovorax sp. Root434]|uniref:autoinducer binding domain-containing protein n=1 Tax=Variovorax sp. Root434 TaxID=1736536 RepID=UPI0006F7B364|nr:autoinducer binding domain-containing protein [Variovorax sp. Root434]KQX20646.1 LuxR family transcriptional regulator [Variovorax sp. Root434]
MNEWTQDVLGRLSQASEPSEVLAQISVATRHLGFEHCAYGLRTLVPFTRQKTLMFSTYDERWNYRYINAGYLLVDPTVAHGVHSGTPVIWSDEVFRSAPQMWDEARSFGLRVGWAQSVFEPDARIGMLTLARSGEPLTAAEILAKDPCLQWLVHTAHRAFCGLLGGSPLEGLESLTKRQVEVLRWTGDGKTSDEIASILCISKPTVEFHLQNAMARLGAPTKSSAAAFASRLGLLN